MGKLQPAGLVDKISSFFFPKKLEVQVRAEQLPDGTIELIPIYLIDGQEVDAPSVKDYPSQTILGYSVIASDTMRNVRRQGQTKVTKRKAAEYLEQLRRQGVVVRSRKGAVSPSVREVKPDVTLTLNPDDTLDVHSTLATSRGEVVEKPVNLDQLRHDEGWYIVGDDLVHVPITNPTLDSTVITGTSPSHFNGNSVPQFLKNIETFSGQFGHVAKSDNLQDLAIYGDRSQHRVRVDGE